MYSTAEILDQAITDIRKLASRPRPVEDEDVAVEPISALVDLYSSTARPAHATVESEKIRPENLVIDTNRNNSLTSFAGRFRRAGMEYEEILAGLRAINENRCAPPLNEREVEKISRSICRYEPEDPVLKDSAILSAPGDGVAAERKLRFLTAREISEMTPEEVGWVVRPYVARGAITEIDGKPKTAGKTTLVSHMVKAVVYGEKFLGEPTTKTGVVYLTEQSSGTFRVVLDRADLLERDDLTVLHWSDTSGFGWEQVVRAAAEEAVARGAGLLVVDTLPQFARLQGDAENNAGAALAALQPLQEAAAIHNLAVVIVRHERKSGGEVGDSGRGSSAFAGAVDIILSVRRTEGNGNANVRTIQAAGRFDEIPPVQVVELTARGYEARGEGTALTAINARASILKTLPTSGPGMTLEEIMEATEVGRTTTQDELRKMVNKEEIIREGEGKKGNPYRYWRPVPLSGLGDGPPPSEILSAATPSPGVAEREDRVEAEKVEDADRSHDAGETRQPLDPEALYDDEQKFDAVRIEQIQEVLHQDWIYQCEDPQNLIDQDVFYELEFDPSPAEVQQAQQRVIDNE